MADRPVTIALLGALRFERDGQEIRELAAPQSRALLLYLALAGAPAARDTLCGLLWPEVAEASAKLRLRVALARLREALPGRIQADRRSVRFQTLPGDVLDLAILESRLEALAMASTGPSASTELADLLGPLRQVLAEDLEVPDTEPYRHWLAEARAAWDTRVSRALSSRARLAAASVAEPLPIAGSAGSADGVSGDRFRQPVAWLREALRRDPIDEALARQLMLELARMGEGRAALETHAALVDALDTQLGVPAEQATEALRARIEAAQARGRRHLLPPADALARAAIHDAEVKGLADWLGDPERRLISLIAAPGSGRAALARAALDRVLDRFLDGVLWLPRRSAAANWGLEARLQTALGRREGEGPARGELAARLAPLEHLIVLDGIENDPEAADLIGDWLLAAPQTRWLVLCQAPLGFVFERRFLLER